MSDRRFFSGDSITQAINQAAQHFKLMPDEIDYKLVEKRHGFLKVRRKVVIEVSESSPRKAEAVDQAQQPIEPSAAAPEAPSHQEQESQAWSWTSAGDGEAAEAAPGSEHVEPERAQPEEEAAVDAEQVSEVASEESIEPAAAEDAQEPTGHFELAEAPQPASKRYPPAQGEEAEAAGRALEKIVALTSLDLEYEILQGEEQLEIELWGPGQKILLRDRGRLLLAIQHLLPRVARGLIGRSVSCRVDSDNFHEIREERLRDMAQRAADDVRHRGRSKTLEPMSPDERRIVHLTLSDYPGVETESQGSGLFKRVMVRKIRQGGRPRGFDPYNR